MSPNLDETGRGLSKDFQQPYEILSGRPHLDRRTIRVLNQSLWLKNLTARQRCLAGNANTLLFLRDKSPDVPTANLEDQETVFVRPLSTDQPRMRDSVSVARTPP
ncbi:hypothetical protein CSKR_110159 [Clonorchis sinensis]|uniref:Uncharacterized protein n=1 Tax=Clonorchis sinensis TaxID=79923 RepID=A0A3R7CCQ1_CLOSI|nr:hypothetical protein CSKR_110159 [Clonorchis sinensis]